MTAMKMDATHSTKHDFDLEVVLSHFKKCLKKDSQMKSDDADVDMKEYLSAYHELCRFFTMTGRLFGFVAKDIETKIRCIEHHMHSPHGQPYLSVGSMIQHEVKKKMTHMKSPVQSGCRTLLRLHWALEFILSFMQEIRDSHETEKASKIAWAVYSRTLYHHHPWLTRQLAKVAVHALPSKKHLIEIMCKHQYEQVLELLDNVITEGHMVYDHIHHLLDEANLLEIP